MKLLLALSLMVAAAPAVDTEGATAKAFVAAVKRGDDVRATYPDAVSEREGASLQRVKGCNPVNLMRQKAGRYTVVWYCRSGKLGMSMDFSDGKLALVETFEVVTRRVRES